MLINTVILFLRDALPIFVIASLLIEHKGNWRLWLLPGVGFGLIGILLLFFGMPFISQLLDGAGFEVIQASMLIITYGLCVTSFLLLGCFPKREVAPELLAAILAMVMMLNGSNFLVFITGYWSQEGFLLSMMLGVILGIGICASIGILLILALKAIQCPALVNILLLAFATAQLAQTTSLMQQIGWLNDNSIAWNSSAFLSNQHELGHLLNAFLGYEDTPSISYVLIYACGLILPLLLLVFYRRHRFHLLHKGSFE